MFYKTEEEGEDTGALLAQENVKHALIIKTNALHASVDFSWEVGNVNKCLEHKWRMFSMFQLLQDLTSDAGMFFLPSWKSLVWGILLTLPSYQLEQVQLYYNLPLNCKEELAVVKPLMAPPP